MKILLDECVTKKLKKHFNKFEIYTLKELELNKVKITSTHENAFYSNQFS